jgi:hypothetical protein
MAQALPRRMGRESFEAVSVPGKLTTVSTRIIPTTILINVRGPIGLASGTCSAIIVTLHWWSLRCSSSCEAHRRAEARLLQECNIVSIGHASGYSRGIINQLPLSFVRSNVDHCESLVSARTRHPNVQINRGLSLIIFIALEGFMILFVLLHVA